MLCTVSRRGKPPADNLVYYLGSKSAVEAHTKKKKSTLEMFSGAKSTWIHIQNTTCFVCSMFMPRYTYLCEKECVVEKKVASRAP